MSLPKLTAQALLVVPLIVGVSLLAGCKNENAADTKNTLVAETQSCSPGATALFAACDDQNATTNETLTNNDTLPAGDTVVTTAGSGADGDSHNTVVVLDNLIAPVALPTPAAELNYDEEIAQINKYWINSTAKTIATHKDNYIESIYQSAHTPAMLATGAGTGPTIVKENGPVIDPNTLRAIIGSTYATPDGMERLHQIINHWDQKLAAVNWQRSSALWVQSEYRFLSSYFNTQTRYYVPEIAGLDFKNDMYGSGQFISTWLNAASQDKLTPLMTFNGSQINERTRLVTLNSEVVNAAWPELFDATQTTDERFKMLDGTMKLVPTMHTTGTFDIAASDQYMAFQLPIKNSTLAMLVIMPKAGQFATVQTQLDTPPLLEKIIAALRPTNTTLHLPHFSIATTKEVKIPSASDEAFADFSAVNGQGHLYLKQMAQMATIDVTESGMVARAGGLSILEATKGEPLSVWNPSNSSKVSAIWIGQDLNPTGQTFDFMSSTPCYYPPLLHPFMFVIRDTITSTPLYAGVWTTPPGAAMTPDWTTNAFGPGACKTSTNPDAGTSSVPTFNIKDSPAVEWDTDVWGLITPTAGATDPFAPYP